MSELNAPPGLKLLALDIDGTIAPEEQLPSDRVVAAIREVHTAGVEIMLVTGRPVHAVREVASLLDLDELWVASSNGAVTSISTPEEWRIVATESFDPQPAADAAHAIDPLVAMVFEEPGEGYRVSQPVPSAVGQEPHLPWSGVPAQTTFAAFASRAVSPEILLAAVQGKGANAMPWWSDDWGVVDLQPVHVTKATAIQALARRRDFSAHHCAAVGDYFNDAAMLEWVGWGVAMGDAPAEVKAAADAVAPTLAQDGVLSVISAILATR